MCAPLVSDEIATQDSFIMIEDTKDRPGKTKLLHFRLAFACGNPRLNLCISIIDYNCYRCTVSAECKV